MGLFSRKKPQQDQRLPPLPRFQAPSQGPQQGPQFPTYEPEFTQPEEQPGLPTFPDAAPIKDQPLPEPPTFPRPLEQPPTIPRPPLEEPRYQRAEEPVERQPMRAGQRPFEQQGFSSQQPFRIPEQPVRIQPPPQPRQQAPAEIPVREPAFLRRQQYPDREAVATNQALPFQRVEQQPRFLQPLARPQPVQQTPPVRVQPSIQQQPVTMPVEDKPVFVKIGQYREAMSHLELLKQKIREADALLTRLEDLRAKENAEITNAHSMLANIKDKLLAIDKQLFEV